MIKYTLLKDDLDELIAGYESNPNISENQRRIWHKEGKKVAIPHVSFGYNGKNNSNPLHLLKEDGFDGQPVGSLLGSTVRGFWDYGDWHIFPPQRDLVRIGIFFGLDLYRITALALKGEWEKFYGQTLNNYRANTAEVPLIDILKRADNHDLHAANSRFNPNTRALFDLLEFHNRVATQTGYSAETFDSMVQNMLKKELHWKANAGREIALFSSEEIQRFKLLREGTTAQQEAFWIARMSWNQLYSDCDDINLRIENIRLQHREIERRWLTIFGALEVMLQEVMIRCNNSERRLLLIQANPEMNPEQLDKAVAAEEEKQQKRLQSLKYKAEIANALEQPEIDGTAMDQQMIRDYKKECKRLIREIYRLIHPDLLENHPNYQDLTEKQKDELQQFLMASLEPDKDELGVPKGFINADMRSPDGLRRVLERIREILDSAGIDITVDTTIKGNTLQEQMTWLNKEIERLERNIAFAVAHFRAMSEDRDVQRKRALLDLPEQHEKIKQEMKEKIDFFTKQTGELDSELAQFFQR